MVCNRFGNSITAPVVHVNPLGNGLAEVHIESDFYIEAGHAHPATYATPGHEAKGTYRISGKTFTESMTHFYHGVFARSQ